MNDALSLAEPSTRIARMLNRLAGKHGFTVVEQADFENFCDSSGITVLFFAEDPSRVPESWDVSVVLPEVLKGLPPLWRAGVVAPETGRALKPRYGFRRFPAVVFLRDGGYLGVIEGMCDWREFIEDVRTILGRPVSRPPTVGIEVRAEASASCH